MDNFNKMNKKDKFLLIFGTITFFMILFSLVFVPTGSAYTMIPRPGPITYSTAGLTNDSLRVNFQVLSDGETSGSCEINMQYKQSSSSTWIDYDNLWFTCVSDYNPVELIPVDTFGVSGEVYDYDWQYNSTLYNMEDGGNFSCQEWGDTFYKGSDSDWAIFYHDEDDEMFPWKSFVNGEPANNLENLSAGEEYYFHCDDNAEIYFDFDNIEVDLGEPAVNIPLKFDSLSPGTEYDFRCKLINSVHTVYSNILSYTTKSYGIYDFIDSFYPSDFQTNITMGEDIVVNSKTDMSIQDLDCFALVDGAAVPLVSYDSKHFEMDSSWSPGETCRWFIRVKYNNNNYYSDYLRFDTNQYIDGILTSYESIVNSFTPVDGETDVPYNGAKLIEFNISSTLDQDAHIYLFDADGDSNLGNRIIRYGQDNTDFYVSQRSGCFECNKTFHWYYILMYEDDVPNYDYISQLPGLVSDVYVSPVYTYTTAECVPGDNKPVISYHGYSYENGVLTISGYVNDEDGSFITMYLAYNGVIKEKKTGYGNFTFDFRVTSLPDEYSSFRLMAYDGSQWGEKIDFEVPQDIIDDFRYVTRTGVGHDYDMIIGFVAVLTIACLLGVLASGVGAISGFIGGLVFFSIPGHPFTFFPVEVLAVIGLVGSIFVLYMLKR